MKLPEPRTPDPHEAPGIRWGVLGPGGIARTFADAVAVGTAGVVAAVGSRSLERAQAFAAEFGIDRAHGSYDDLVADDGVDAIYVASPHSEHHAHALLAVGAGKPVLVEKAFTRSAAEAREVFAAAQERGLLVAEAMWSRYLPHYDVVRQAVESGLIGEVTTVFADHGQYLYPNGPARLSQPELAGGALLDLGVYPRLIRRPRARPGRQCHGRRHADRPRGRRHDERRRDRRGRRPRRVVVHDGRGHPVHRRRQRHGRSTRAEQHVLRSRVGAPPRP